MKPNKKIELHETKIPYNQKVPEGYFAELEESILSKTVLKKRSIVFRPWFKYASIAASVALFFGLYLVSKTTSHSEITFTNLTAEVILETEELELTEDDMLSLVSLEDIQSFGSNLNKEFNEDMTEDFDPLDVYDEI